MSESLMVTNQVAIHQKLVLMCDLGHDRVQLNCSKALQLFTACILCITSFRAAQWCLA